MEERYCNCPLYREARSGSEGFKESERIIMWWSGVVAPRVLSLEPYIGANGLLHAPTAEFLYDL